MTIAAISGSIAMFEFLWINIISSAKSFFDTIPDIKFIISVVIIVLVWWIVGRYIFSGEEHPVKVWLEMAESLLFLIYIAFIIDMVIKEVNIYIK